jgi:hypothetical protein
MRLASDPIAEAFAFALAFLACVLVAVIVFGGR